MSARPHGARQRFGRVGATTPGVQDCVMVKPSAPIAESSHGTAAAGRHQLVLVVDDDRAVRRLVRRTLEGAGYQVLEAIDGADAMRTLDAQPVALVVTDVLMPERDGIELVLQLASRDPRVPIIVMSGGGTGLDVETLVTTALAFGASAALAKPFSINALLSVVGDVLRSGPPRDGEGHAASPA